MSATLVGPTARRAHVGEAPVGATRLRAGAGLVRDPAAAGRWTVVGRIGGAKSKLARLGPDRKPTAGTLALDGVDAIDRRRRRRGSCAAACSWCSEPDGSLNPRGRRRRHPGGAAVHQHGPAKRERPAAGAAMMAKVGLAAEQDGRYPAQFSAASGAGSRSPRHDAAAAVWSPRAVSGSTVSVQAPVIKIPVMEPAARHGLARLLSRTISPWSQVDT